MRAGSFNDLVRGCLQCKRNGEAECVSGLEVDHQLKLCGLQNRHFARIRAFQNLSNVFSRLAIHPANAWTIAQERADRRELTHEADDGKLMTLGERDDLFSSIKHYRIGSGDDSVNVGT